MILTRVLHHLLVTIFCLQGSAFGQSYSWSKVNNTSLNSIGATHVRTIRNDLDETILATNTRLYKSPPGSLQFTLVATLSKPLRDFEFYKSESDLILVGVGQNSSSFEIYDVPSSVKTSAWTPLASIPNLYVNTVAIDYYYSYAILGAPDMLYLVDMLTPSNPIVVDTLNTTTKAGGLGVSSSIRSVAGNRGEYCWAEGDSSTQCKIGCVSLSDGKFGTPTLYSLKDGSCSSTALVMTDVLLFVASRTGKIYSSLSDTIDIGANVAATSSNSPISDILFDSRCLFVTVPSQNTVNVVYANDYQNMVKAAELSPLAVTGATDLHLMTNTVTGFGSFLVAQNNGASLTQASVNVSGMGVPAPTFGLQAPLYGLSAPTIVTLNENKFLQFTSENKTASIKQQDLQIVSSRSKTTFFFTTPWNLWVKSQVLVNSVWIDQATFSQNQINSEQVRLEWIGPTTLNINATIAFTVDNGRGASTTAKLHIGILGKPKVAPEKGLWDQVNDFLLSLYTTYLVATIAVILFLFSLILFCVSWCCVRCKSKQTNENYADLEMNPISKSKSTSNNLLVKKSMSVLNDQPVKSAYIEDGPNSARPTEMEGQKNEINYFNDNQGQQQYY